MAGLSAEQLKNMHWSEILADRVAKEKSPPFVVTSGITTSGPTHLGTLCEFLFPNAVTQQLTARGEGADFYFIADIYDAFDSVPSSMKKYEATLTPHLGKPLCDVPDPLGCCKSFGDHFLNEVTGVMKRFNVNPKIIRAVDVYKAGKFDGHAQLFLEHEEEAKKVVAESSMRELPNWWSPLMPVCQNCGRIATTRLTAHGSDWYEYACDRDVEYTKGCGFKGKNKLSEHQYKLTWRLHWPAWMVIFGTSVEGAGVDHHTKGGSWDTCQEVFRKMLKREPPVGYKFGFILFQGKKYSKSKGIGMGVMELLELMPPELITYSLIRPDLQENKDVDPTGIKLMNLYEDFQNSAKLAEEGSGDASRAEHKKITAFKLSTGGKLRWKAPFADVLMYYQLYRDWDKVAERSGDREGSLYLKPFIEKWVEKEFAPEEFMFAFKPSKISAHTAAVADFAGKLKDGMDAVAIHNLVFETAKAHNAKPGDMFTILYTALLSKEKGPRMGKLVEAIGPSKVRETLMQSVSGGK